ncbi:MAG: hypothetical protein AAGK97_04050 [Bacteroidota bacterium]
MRQFLYISILLGIFIACNTSVSDNDKSHFKILDGSQTGIDFVNEVQDTKDFNIMKYLYFYNGGGVAIGDVNNDQLPDLFFTSNQGLDQLYINKGSLKFENASV